jgi:nitrate reductase NapE component
MVDEYVEVEEQGCLGQIRESIGSVGGGLGMIAIAFLAMFWNECRAVDRAEDLEFGKGAVVEVKSDKVDSANDGELIHTTGEATSEAPLTEPDLGFTVPGLQLQRDVQIYQWVENEKTKTEKKGTKKVKKTTYSYEKEWVDSPVNSSSFKKSKYHKNRGELPFQDLDVSAEDAKVGAFEFPPSFINKLPSTSLTISDEMLEQLPSEYSAAKPSGEYLYLQGSPSKPIIGDIRVSYSVVEPGTVTVVAGQQSGAFTEFTHDKMNGDIAMVDTGKKSSQKMFKQAEEANVALTWGIRIFGWIFMMAGFGLLFRPIDVLADFVPILGGIVDFGTNIAAGILGTGLTFLAIAMGWIVARPLMGILFLLLAVGFLGGTGYLAWKYKNKDDEGQPAPRGTT